MPLSRVLECCEFHKILLIGISTNVMGGGGDFTHHVIGKTFYALVEINYT